MYTVNYPLRYEYTSHNHYLSLKTGKFCVKMTAFFTGVWKIRGKINAYFSSVWKIRGKKIGTFMAIWKCMKN